MPRSPDSVKVFIPQPRTAPAPRTPQSTSASAVWPGPGLRSLGQANCVAATGTRIAAVPDGFRSSFCDWASEETDHPREAALAHKVGSRIDAACRRSDLFERRRRLMDDWTGYQAGPSREPQAGAALYGLPARDHCGGSDPQNERGGWTRDADAPRGFTPKEAGNPRQPVSNADSREQPGPQRRGQRPLRVEGWGC